MRKVRIICLLIVFAELCLGHDFREYMNFTYVSLIPIGFLLAPLRNVAQRTYRHKFNNLKYDGDKDKMVVTAPAQSAKEAILEYLNTFLIILPVILPFVFFFHDVAKVLFPLGVCVIVIVVISVYAAVKSRKERRIQREQEEKELREQQKREEQGKWR